MAYFIFATFDSTHFQYKKSIEFLFENLHFAPIWVTSESRYDDGDFYTPEIAADLINHPEDIGVYDDTLNTDFPNKSVVIFSNSWEKSVTVTWYSNILFPSEYVQKVFRYMATAEGLINCVYYDHDDVNWQSEIFVSNYEVFGKSTVGLKYKIDPNLGKIIDTSENYGRKIISHNFQFIAAAEMMLGSEAKKIVDFEKLKSFPSAEKVIEYPNGYLYIKLFNITHSPSTPSIRQIQKSFWEVLNTNKVLS